MNRATATLVTTLIAASLAWAGCAGDPPSTLIPIQRTTASGGGPSSGSGSGPSTNAQAFFETQVYPEVYQQCALCHGPQGTSTKFLEDSASGTYMTLEALPTPVPMINPPDCSHIMLTTLGEHSGTALAGEAETLVIDWLTMEAAERGLSCDSGGGGTTMLDGCEQAIADFQDCMSFNHWVNSGMDIVPHQQTLGDGACYGCHETGVGRALLSQDPRTTFDAHQADRYILQKLVTCAISQGEFQGLVPSLRYINKGIEQCVSSPCHPKFVMNAEREQAITDFVEDTIAAMENGTCADLDVPPPEN